MRTCTSAEYTMGRAGRTRDPSPMKSASLRRLGLAIVCGVLGLALNRWRLGTAAPLLFGRVATLPIAILFGPIYGAAAALVAALPATSNAFSPAVLLLPIEAVVLLGFLRRGPSPPGC